MISTFVYRGVFFSESKNIMYFRACVHSYLYYLIDWQVLYTGPAQTNQIEVIEGIKICQIH